jgi:hypothetical protein
MDRHILKVKFGCNPNSSSIGTQVGIFLQASVLLVLAGNTLALLLKKSGHPGSAADEKTASKNEIPASDLHPENRT